MIDIFKYNYSDIDIKLLKTINYLLRIMAIYSSAFADKLCDMPIANEIIKNIR